MTDRESLITVLEEAPARITELWARPGSDSAVDEGWNRVDIIRHVQASDAILAHRIMQILVREDPPLPAFDDRKWGSLLAEAAIPMEEQLSGYRIGRAQLIGVLRSLSETDWLRGGTHEVLGRQTIGQIIKHMADHETEHIDQLLSLDLDAQRKDAQNH